MRFTKTVGSVSTRAKNWARALLYPGLDLHTRNRASLCRFWKTGPRDVLDAGSGNGYFSWLAYRSGARVLAINFNESQIEKARDFLIGYRGADETRLKFVHLNLYDLGPLEAKFDEIICYETLEHVLRDRDVANEFYRLLRPGGVLHLCCPYALHPYHAASGVDINESGGHVRLGYTESDYTALLTPLGFEICKMVGIGSPSLCRADDVFRALRHRWGDGFALPLLPLALPFVWMSKLNPKVPFSLYVRAQKP